MKPRLHPLCLLALAAMAGLFSGGGCARKDSPPKGTSGPGKIVIGASLMNLSAEFIADLDRSMRREAARLGVTLEVNDAQRNADKQLGQVDGFVAERVDAIILNPCEVGGSSPAVDAAARAGIPLVNVNSETRAVPTAFVGSRDEDAARIGMGYIAQCLRGRGGVVIMQGFLGQAAQLKRDQGARDVLARTPGLALLSSQTAEWDRAEAANLMENWIQTYGSRIDAVFAQNDEMAMGALLAIEEAHLKRKIIVVGVDGIADALAAVQAGRLDATVFQDAKAQGAAAVDAALRLARRQPWPRETLIPFQLVTRANVNDFMR